MTPLSSCIPKLYAWRKRVSRSLPQHVTQVELQPALTKRHSQPCTLCTSPLLTRTMHCPHVSNAPSTSETRSTSPRGFSPTPWAAHRAAPMHRPAQTPAHARPCFSRPHWGGQRSSALSTCSTHRPRVRHSFAVAAVVVGGVGGDCTQRWH